MQGGGNPFLSEENVVLQATAWNDFTRVFLWGLPPPRTQRDASRRPRDHREGLCPSQPGATYGGLTFCLGKKDIIRMDLQGAPVAGSVNGPDKFIIFIIDGGVEEINNERIQMDLMMLLYGP